MIRALKRFGRRRPIAFAALLALVLSLRIAGAGLLAPPAEGYAAICSGGQVVYIRIAEDGAATPVEDPSSPEAPASTACAYLGLVAALAPVAPVLPPAPSARPAAPAPSPAPAVAPRPAAAFSARAPPRFV